MIYRVFILKRDLKKTYICNILLFYINYKNLAYYNTKMDRIKFVIIYRVFKHNNNNKINKFDYIILRMYTLC